MKLSETSPHPETVYVVTQVNASKELSKRYSELGIYPNSKIKVLKKIPFSGPIVVELCGTSLALRYEEAECIQIKTL